MAVKRILIVAGGTGGHIFPALAVAVYLRALDITPHWLGARQGMETRIVPQHGFGISDIPIMGLRGKGLARWLLAPYAIARATLRAVRVIMRIKPAVVLGMGGFVSGPGGLAAWLCRVPLVIHEQNAVAGLTNRLLSRIATRVLVAYPGTVGLARAGVTGNPVRAEIANLARTAKTDVHSAACLNILVLGGSQGARALNNSVPAALALLARTRAIAVRHQSGAHDLTTTQDNYRVHQLCADVVPFIADMADAYRWADLVICRAGAMTIAEISVAGVPSILVPFPYAVDDHQTANARYLVSNGAAKLLPEADATPESICAAVRELAQEANGLSTMAQRARACAFPRATDEVAQACMELMHA